MIQIEAWDIDRIREYENNPKINDPEVPKMVKSIKRFGFTLPILVDSSSVLVDGHLRLKAAKKMGLKSVPVVVCDNWSEEQKRAFRILSSESAKATPYDIKLLSQEILDLTALGFELDDLWFTEQSLDALLHPVAEEPELEQARQSSSGNSVKFSDEQWEVILRACYKLREEEQQEDISEARCLELIAAEYAS